MLQTHHFYLLSNKFRESEKLIIVLKQNNGEPSVIVWRILHICQKKLVLFRLLILDVPDSVITLIAIAYNVNNNLDKVLLPIVTVCTVYHGNIINSSRLVPEVAVTKAFVVLGSRVLVDVTSWIAC